MEFDQLHFAHPMWLWGSLIIPLMWLLFLLFYKPNAPMQQLGKFIDAHLLPYLLIKKEKTRKSSWKTMLAWSFAWTCLILALAGPRWSFREIEIAIKDQSLVIILDLSESMNATDIKPSRLIRAKQKIEDLLNSSEGVKIGLIAFAADPHMIAPLTEDKETIKYLLPSLDTDIVHVQGSKLSAAFEMAANMLDAEPGNNKALLVISDGDFEDSRAMSIGKKIANSGITIHSMGIGTIEGTILQDKQGNNVKKNGVPILSKLVKNRLEDISKMGNGIYLDGKYMGDEGIILNQLASKANALSAGQKRLLWDEHFYLLLLPILPILLWWFRRGAILASFFLIFIPSFNVSADITENYFMNSEEHGKHALDMEDYDQAVEAFQDPFKKGVAYYRAGKFAEAEKMFRQTISDETPDAAYNLGNTFAQQQKFKKAITAYENVLKKWPEHEKARDNLALLKKMMEEQKKEKNQSKNSEDKNDETDESDENDNSNNDQSQKDKEDSKKSKDLKDDKKQKQNHDQSGESNEPDQSDQQDNERSSEDNVEDDLKNPEDRESAGNDRESENQEQKQENTEGNKQSESDLADKQQANESDDQDHNDNGSDEAQQIEGDTELPEDQKPNEGCQVKSQADQEADYWLNRINVDPKNFLKNKFYVESKRNETKEGMDPW